MGVVTDSHNKTALLPAPGKLGRHLTNVSASRFSKCRDRPYQSGRSKHWIKVKNPPAPGDGEGDGTMLLAIMVVVKDHRQAHISLSIRKLGHQ
jgi:hypothetical protein